MSELAAIHVLKIPEGVFGAITHKNASYFLCTQVNINLAAAASGLIKQTKISIKHRILQLSAKHVINICAARIA